MAIYTYGVEDVVLNKYGMVRTTNLRATYAGHLFDAVYADGILENGMNVKIGDNITAEGRECVEATLPAVEDQIALVANVVKTYDNSTAAKRAEYNYFIPQGAPAKSYQVEQFDRFGVADYMFTTKIGDVPAIDNYVVVDGAGKWTEVASEPDKTAYGFIGQIYGYETGDNERIVLIRTIQNVQL